MKRFLGASWTLGILLWPSLVGASLPELLPMPSPVVERMEELVRDQLLDARQAVDDELASAEPDRTELVKALGQLGQFYLSYHLTEAAESVFRNAQRLAEEDPRWPYYLGVLYQNERRLDEAEAALRQVLELRADDLPATVRLARVLLLKEQPEKAQPLFRSLLGREGYKAAAAYGLGRIAQGRGENDAAIPYFEAALKEQPEAVSIYQSLGLSWRALGDLDRAREALRQSGQAQVRFADPLIQTLVAEGAAAQMLHGIVAYRDGDYEKALALHQRALELDSDNPTVRRELGLTLQRLGRLDEAISQFRLACELVPRNARARYDLGRALTEQEETREDGRETLRQALELEPALRVAHLALGEMAMEDERFEEALDAYQTALDLTPLDPRARRGRALAWSRLGRQTEALAELDALFQEFPEDVEAALDLAVLFASSGQGARATQVLVTATQQATEPAFKALAHFNLANLLQEQGQPQNALRHYRHAVEHGPDFRDAHFNLALLLIRGRLYAEAAKHFEQAVDLDPQDAQAHFLLATALLYAGQEALASQALEQGLEAAPESTRLTHLLARLLATAEAEELRDGTRAETLARQAFTNEQSSDHAETLAMAVAAQGRTDEAAAWQLQLLSQAERSSAPAPLIARLRANLERYQNGQIAQRPWASGS